MPNRRFPAPLAACAAVLLAACGVDSPTAVPSLDGIAALAKKPATCTFMTPNAKTHGAHAKGTCPSPKPVAQVTGTYEITRFIFRQLEWVGDERVISGPYDVADFLGEEGAQFSLTLHPDGSTSGRFDVPEDENDPGSGIALDLAGSWRLDGDTVVLGTGTFFDEMTYTYADGKLTAGAATVGDESDPLFVEEVILTRR